MKKISKSELLSKYGIDLPFGKFKIINKENYYEVLSIKDNTEGCVLLGNGRANSYLLDSRSAVNKVFSAVEKALDRGDDVTLEVK